MIGHDHAGVDVDTSGYIQKKSRSGIFQSRYFKTTGSLLKYWADKASCEKGNEPGAVYDLRDARNFERPPGSKQLNLVFTDGDKFKLELKFTSEEECTSWTEVLSAKRNLYSINKLLVDLDVGTEFRTKTFGALMILSDREQSQWILDRLDDVFQAAADDASTNMLRSDAMWVIGAARICIEELIATCEECSLEMESRNPKVIAHCRSYMHRYAELIKGRLALELSMFTSMGSKHISEMGERALCAAIGLMTRMDALRVYTFMPHNLLPALNSCLFSVGELMSALLNLSIERIEAWFRNVVALSPIQRGARLVEVNNVLAGALKLIDFQTNEENLHQDLLMRVTMSLLLNFADQLVLIDLSEYDEQSLIGHIKACHTIVDILPSDIEVARPTPPPVVSPMYPHKSQDNDGDDDNGEDGDGKDARHGRQGAAYQSDRSNNYSGSSDVISMRLPPAVIDAVESACLTGARSAAVLAVRRFSYSMQDLIDMLVQEKQMGWIGGAACEVFLNRFDVWLREFVICIPSQYETIVKIELARLVVKTYMGNLIRVYQEHKRFSLSKKGVEQVSCDISRIQDWLDSLFNGVGRALEEYMFLSTVNSFLSCGEDAMLASYAASVQSFGIQYSLHVYDLLRLLLKMRKVTDCSTKVRKSALGICAEFLSQLQTAIAADSSLLSGTRVARKVGRVAKTKLNPTGDYSSSSSSNSAGDDPTSSHCSITAQLAELLSYSPSTSLFDELFPKVGVEHCTGKRWGPEKMSDPIAVRMLVARMVTETIAVARCRHREAVELLALTTNASTNSGGNTGSGNDSGYGSGGAGTAGSNILSSREGSRSNSSRNLSGKDPEGQTVDNSSRSTTGGSRSGSRTPPLHPPNISDLLAKTIATVDINGNPHKPHNNYNNNYNHPSNNIAPQGTGNNQRGMHPSQVKQGSASASASAKNPWDDEDEVGSNYSYNQSDASYEGGGGGGYQSSSSSSYSHHSRPPTPSAPPLPSLPSNSSVGKAAGAGAGAGAGAASNTTSTTTTAGVAMMTSSRPPRPPITPSSSTTINSNGGTSTTSPFVLPPRRGGINVDRSDSSTTSVSTNTNSAAAATTAPTGNNINTNGTMSTNITISRDVSSRKIVKRVISSPPDTTTNQSSVSNATGGSRTTTPSASDTEAEMVTGLRSISGSGSNVSTPTRSGRKFCQGELESSPPIVPPSTSVSPASLAIVSSITATSTSTSTRSTADHVGGGGMESSSEPQPKHKKGWLSAGMHALYKRSHHHSNNSNSNNEHSSNRTDDNNSSSSSNEQQGVGGSNHTAQMGNNNNAADPSAASRSNTTASNTTRACESENVALSLHTRQGQVVLSSVSMPVAQAVPTAEAVNQGSIAMLPVASATPATTVSTSHSGFIAPPTRAFAPSSTATGGSPGAGGVGPGVGPGGRRAHTNPSTAPMTNPYADYLPPDERRGFIAAAAGSGTGGATTRYANNGATTATANSAPAVATAVTPTPAASTTATSERLRKRPPPSQSSSSSSSSSPAASCKASSASGSNPNPFDDDDDDDDSPKKPSSQPHPQPQSQVQVPAPSQRRLLFPSSVPAAAPISTHSAPTSTSPGTATSGPSRYINQQQAQQPQQTNHQHQQRGDGPPVRTFAGGHFGASDNVSSGAASSTSSSTNSARNNASNSSSGGTQLSAAQLFRQRAAAQNTGSVTGVSSNNGSGGGSSSSGARRTFAGNSS